jgi:F-type H+-transporting ATPase subunit b
MLFAWVNLLIIYLFLKKILFKPVKNMIDSRQKEVDDMYSNAEAAETDAKALKAEYEEKLASANEASEEILRTAQRRATLKEEEIIKEATVEAARIRDRASDEIALEKKRMLGEIKDEFDGHNRVDDVAEGLACGAGCEIGDVIDEIKARYPEDCAEAVEILRKFDEETRANVAGGDEKSAEKTLLKTWFRAQLPKSQKKISDEASVALGRLRVDAHKVQGGKLKEAMIRLRRDGE